MHQRRRESERGAVFIHVAIGLLVLLGFIAFVADYGMLWVSRNQAQNAADAGALAGVSALAFDQTPKIAPQVEKTQADHQ
jgi:Flp pilus assembly protein TadG